VAKTCHRCGCDLAGKQWSPVPVPRNPHGRFYRPGARGRYGGPECVIVCADCYVIYDSRGHERPELEALAHADEPDSLELGVDIQPKEEK
jgi:hypothetical protein